MNNYLHEIIDRIAQQIFDYQYFIRMHLFFTIPDSPESLAMEMVGKKVGRLY